MLFCGSFPFSVTDGGNLFFFLLWRWGTPGEEGPQEKPNQKYPLCLDSRNNEVVAFGKGIGFTKPPYDVPLSKIDRTFYDVDEEQLAVLKRIPEDVLEAAAEIVDLANEKMDNQFRENVVFTLADHIDFAIQRYRKNINIKLPLLYEVRQLYPGESELGRQALDILKKAPGSLSLPREEAAAIALHFVNYKAQADTAPDIDYGSLYRASHGHRGAGTECNGGPGRLQLLPICHPYALHDEAHPG